MDTTQVLIAEEPPKSRFKFLSKFPWKKGAVLLIIITILTAAWFFLKDKPQTKLVWDMLQEGFPWSKQISETKDKIFNTSSLPQQPQQQQQDQGNAQESINFHPSLFYIDLEYDPKTGLIKQLSEGGSAGDPPRLLPNEPQNISSNKFVYKLEIISSTNEILDSGWSVDYKEIIEDENGKLKFRITTLYKPGSTIKIYLPNKTLLWTGKIPEKI